jgi:hypothetical protein
MRLQFANGLFEQGLVERRRSGGAAFPGHVGLHAGFCMALQTSWSRVSAHGAMRLRATARRAVRRELQAGRDAGRERRLVGVDHRVGQAAGAGDHGTQP